MMKHFIDWIVSFVLNSLWQAPLLFAAGWLAARITSRVGPAAEHRVWVSVQLAQALLPALCASALGWFDRQFAWRTQAHSAEDGFVSVQFGPGIQLHPQGVPHWVIPALAFIYVGVTAWLVGRFLWRCRRVAALRTSSFEPALTAAEYSVWRDCLRRTPIHNVTLRASNEIFAPLTLGVWQPLILLPGKMLHRIAPAELHTVLAHELAHVARRDFLHHLLYEALSLPVSYHPFLWAARERVTESREMVCDRLAAAWDGPIAYGRSLLRLLSLLVDGMPSRFPHAIGIFDAHTVERRVMRLKSSPAILPRSQRLVIVAACSGVLAIAGLSAATLGVHADSTKAATSASQLDGVRSVPAKEMQDHVLTKITPKYPVEAKKMGVQGIVELHAVISEQGKVDRLEVVSGPKELQASALDAVRHWTYKPYVVNGKPVAVETTVNVHYTLKK